MTKQLAGAFEHSEGFPFPRTGDVPALHVSAEDVHRADGVEQLVAVGRAESEIAYALRQPRARMLQRTCPCRVASIPVGPPGAISNGDLMMLSFPGAQP
jgi:hypothetical protein